MNLQKPARWKSDHYLEWLRTRPCCICSHLAAEPHHVRKRADGGTGLKPSDAWAVPVCRDCHAHLQRYDTEWELRGRVFKAELEDVYIEAVKSLTGYLAFLQNQARECLKECKRIDIRDLQKMRNFMEELNKIS